VRRTFHDEDLREWEAYVSGGQPGTEAAARIFFLCLTAPGERARYVPHESGDVATAEKDLLKLDEADLLGLLEDATPLD